MYALATPSSSLVFEVRDLCFKLSSKDKSAKELKNLLDSPHIDALMEAHDNIATNIDESYEMDVFDDESGDFNPYPADAIRIVGIRKGSDNEPLGMTVKIEGPNIIIARILAGGLIDRQGLLHVGDVILEVNGHEVHKPEDLHEHLRKSKESATFKILPSTNDQPAASSCFMRTLYNYDPSEDTLLPCKELGLYFNQGDIIEVLNQVFI